MATTPSAADLQKQIDDAKQKLSSVSSQLLVAQNPNADTYFKQTGETKVDSTTAPVFADVYNQEYGKIKNINMQLGSSAGNPQEKAFFTFNAASEATRTADSKVGAANQQNADYKAQQDKITNWIKDKQSSQTQQIFNNYLQDVLKKEQPALVNNMIDSNNPLFNMTTYQKTDPKNRSASIVYGPMVRGAGNHYFNTPTTVYSYKDEKAAKTMLDSLTTIYSDKFNADPNLQNLWKDSYTAGLKQQVNTLQSQLDVINKKKK